MEQKIKLAEKALANLQNLLTQRAKVNEFLQELNQKEQMLVEVLLEANNITEPITSAKLEEGYLVINTEEKKEKVKKVRKEIVPE